MERALIIKKNWLDKIFNDGKRWEMRSRNTKIRGKIGLIESGSGLIVGEAKLVDSFYINELKRLICADLHQVPDLDLLDKWCYAWALEDVKRYDKPIPYDHPQGAVIWVKL